MARFLRLYDDHIINLDRVNQIYLEFRYDEFYEKVRDFKWCFEFDTTVVKSKTFDTGKEAIAWFDAHVLSLINETS